MKPSAVPWLCILLLMAFAATHGVAQQQPVSDPRVGLKGGLKDAAQAARGMELVTSMPKPAGFFDPRTPAGETVPSDREPATLVDDPDRAAAALLRAVPPRTFSINFANSDLAFQGDYLWIGSFHGINAYNIEDPRRPRLAVSVVCPGGQGDVSVHGTLLFMSVEQTRGRVDCGTQGVTERVSSERFRGLRIFDISNPRRPTQVAAVQTCRGSHTHTLVPDPGDRTHIYVYSSGTAVVRSPQELADCSGLPAFEDPATSLYSIDVIEVPLAAPQQARIVNRSRLFSDPANGAIAGLNRGGNQGVGTQTSSETNECHDITAFPEIGLAAGACAGNGILLDISEPSRPRRIADVADRNFAYWHSATFNGDGTKVIFTDEWGGGSRPRCRATDRPNWGANAIFDIVDRTLRFAGYYKMPAPQTDKENCVAHNGSLVPVPGRDIMVQAWYQGGISVFDFTDSARPIEIAFFDRGPIDPARLVLAGYWSAYWYNGHIYASDIARGLDIFKLVPGEHLSADELAAAGQARIDALNVQQQARTTWPASAAVARSYVDQLTRSAAVDSGRARQVRSALDEIDRTSSKRATGTAALLIRVDALSEDLQRDAAAAGARDAMRLRALVDVLAQRAARLR